MAEKGKTRRVIVSNRLPISLVKERGRWRVQASAGGLVTALAPVLRNQGGVWIGWPGAMEGAAQQRVLDREMDNLGYRMVGVSLTLEELDLYYFGFSNEIIWPLFHGLQSLCNYDPRYWNAYQEVNRKFAQVITSEITRGDFLWVHDYQLMWVGCALRELGVMGPVGFFLHIPFPPMDIFHKLPWRRQILEGLLGFDLVGFQTNRHKRNFLQCVRAMIPDVTVMGQGPVSTVRFQDREIRVGYFPIGIDFESFDHLARETEMQEEAQALKFALRNRTTILGVDRLDYTKGIPYKLDAIRNALGRYPELRYNINFLQVLVPSRETIPQYEELRREIEHLVGQINGEFSEPGWVPVQYIYRSLSRRELVAYYRASEIALITPLEDGMNLVAKEYCAASHDGHGVLILSEFAGAAAQLSRDALMVNPYDREGVADAVAQAFHMQADERAGRMARLRRNVQGQDVFRWVTSFLQTGQAREPGPLRRMGEATGDDQDEYWLDITG